MIKFWFSLICLIFANENNFTGLKNKIRSIKIGNGYAQNLLAKSFILNEGKFKTVIVQILISAVFFCGFFFCDDISLEFSGQGFVSKNSFFPNKIYVLYYSF